MADIKHFGYVMASKILVEGQLPVRFMYREKGDNERDSGWRFFAGNEEQDYMDNPDNIGIYNISTILGFDRTIIPYLDSAIGMAFEREEGLGRFKVSEDFGFEAEEGSDGR